MKDFDNCSQNKIFKILNYIYHCTLIFGENLDNMFFYKILFYFIYKNKFIIITFVLQCANKKITFLLHKTKIIK